MEIQIKKLYELVDSPFVLDTAMTYPTIPESTANFLTDYNTSKAIYDRYFLKEHGNKFVDVDGETEADIILNWKKEIQAIQRIYLDAWAHMYYALDIAYNPVYNVEEHISTQYGAHETDREYGATQDTTQYGATQDTVQYGATQDTTQYGATQDTKEYGATSDTLGTHTDTRTNYSVSFDGTTEKETGKQSDVIGSQTNTSLLHTDVESSLQHSDIASSIQHSDVSSSIQHTDTSSSLAHTDKETSKLHTDTVDRTGNIGIKSASALAQEEVLLRERNIFFKGIFLTISREVGAYYDNYFI